MATVGLAAMLAAMGRRAGWGFQSSPDEPRSVARAGAKEGPEKAATSSKPARILAARESEKTKLTPQEARELTQALRQLQASVQADRKAGSRTVEVQVKRPARTVTPPTLTPAELDGLVARYLTKNDPKVDPAPITTDVEFVRRVYFDLIGKPPTPEQFLAFVRDRSHDKRPG